MLNYLSLALAGTVVIGGWNLYLNYRQRANCSRIAPHVAERARRVLKLTDDEIAKAMAYQKDKLGFEIVSGSINLVFSAGLLAGRVLPMLWEGAQVVTGVPVSGFLHGLFFLYATDFVSRVVSLPLNYYHTFVIEERHGFNKSTRALWVQDQIKTLGLNLGLLYPILAALLHYVVTFFGPSFPNYLFGGGVALVLAAMYIYPAFIQPLFNKCTPLPEGPLRDGISQLAVKVRFPLGKVFEMDASKRSGHSNAYFYGFFNNKRIVLFDTLIKNLQDREILAVLCHEFGHWYHSHTLQMMGMSILQIWAITQALGIALYDVNLATDFGFKAANVLLPESSQVNPVLGFQLLSMAILEPVLNFVMLLINVLSRRNEFQADRFAVTQGFGPELSEGLIKLTKDNKGNINPDWLYAACNYSHPPTVERLEAIEKLVAKKE